MDLRHALTLAPALDPGQGLGLLLGLIGAGAMAASVLLYTPRKRLPFLEPFGPKKVWLELHVAAGAFGVVVVVVAAHATTSRFGISGLANLTMWGVALSGILARYTNRWIGDARFRKECSLEQRLQGCGEFDTQLGPFGSRWVRAAAHGRFLNGARPGLVAMMTQFFLDVGAFVVLACIARKSRQQGARDLLNRQDERCASSESLRRRIVAERNLMLLDILEAAGPFWTQIHVALSIVLGPLLTLHVAAVCLFRARPLFF